MGLKNVGFFFLGFQLSQSQCEAFTTSRRKQKKERDSDAVWLLRKDQIIATDAHKGAFYFSNTQSVAVVVAEKRSKGFFCLKTLIFHKFDAKYGP